MSRLPEVCVVIRAAGERTLDHCVALLEGQVSSRNITVLNERPFAEAVRRTLEIGSQSGCPWTLAVDADVLVFGDALRVLLTEAVRAPQNCFSVEAKVVDRLFGGPRAAGIHLFRSALLEPALELVDEGARTHRPEHTVRSGMNARGCSTVWMEAVVGLHDYEQYRRDYYRKGFVHAQKHSHYLGILEPMWTRRARADADFAAALAGAAQGAIEGGIAATDITRFGPTDFQRYLPDVSEHAPLGVGARPDVEGIRRGFTPEPEFLVYDSEHRKLILRETAAAAAAGANCAAAPSRQTWMASRLRGLLRGWRSRRPRVF
jgi:hypothetical protein